MTQQTDGTAAQQPGAGDDATSSYQQPSPDAAGSAGSAGPAASSGPEDSTDAAAGVALSDDPSTTPPASGRGGKRTAIVAGGLAGLLVLGGAGVYAAQQLSGGGAQPAEVLPGDAFAYLRLDVDPSAGQKVAAVRFLSKLPDIKAFGAGDGRKQLWDLATKSSSDGCLAKFNYDKDIAPWLGERAGLAVRPGGTADRPNLAVAVQVSDEAAAKETLTKLFACDTSAPTDVRTKDGYALVMPGGTGDATMAAIEKGTLAGNTTFQGDMAALGEQGIASMWADSAVAVKEISNLGPDVTSLGGLGALGGLKADETAGSAGRFAAALRFEPASIELSGIVRGAKDVKAPTSKGTEMASLPDDTAAALHISDADAAIEKNWPALKKQIAQLAGADGGADPVADIEDAFGLKLPDDLKALLGHSLTLAMPAQDLGGEQITMGAKVVSSDATRADDVISTVEDATGGTGVLTHKVTGDHLFVATTPEWAAALEKGGKLGASDAFTSAVGDVSKDNLALFVNLDRIEKSYLDGIDGDARAAVEAMKAVGFTVSATSSTEATFSLRVVAN
ncbi:hypothetical protein N865_17255 [Intrasporangium oryzae NRRL B-24470]|uniref:DUF3352 domain-containing protein n=1 Tax=Intrasporangium oryzae NRRL B-24470 TaxID=1386089 RepID=W9GFE0_9MICO|nr:DUF3352 domain-containing protein [Intrasporangium oryzae]EWT03523.1 hypothetical protein N865_17255 [Intrasporangium oryzae NRRL B-24470]